MLRMSDRRGSTHNFFLSANTGLVTVYGLIADKYPFAAQKSGSWQWFLPLAGLAICFAWFALVRSYRRINKAKFCVISEFEKHLPARMFDREDEYLNYSGSHRNIERGMFTRKVGVYCDATFKNSFNITRIEQSFPVTFAAIYLITIAFLVIHHSL